MTQDYTHNSMTHFWSDPSLALEMIDIAKLDALPNSPELTMTTIPMVDLEHP